MPEEMLETEVDTYAPTPEELGKHFSAMDDSVWLINSLKESPREDQTVQSELRSRPQRLRSYTTCRLIAVSVLCLANAKRSALRASANLDPGFGWGLLLSGNRVKLINRNQPNDRTTSRPCRNSRIGWESGCVVQ